jgi:anti-sigma factor RsiW
MNTKKALEWMSRDMDGELSPARQKRLAAYLAAHPELRAEQAAWSDAGAALRGLRAPGAPTPEAAWSDVRRAIRLEGAPADHAERRSLMAMPRVWAGAMAAVVLMCVSVWSLIGVAPHAAIPATDVEMVETGLSDATLVIYTDTETRSVIIWVSSENGSAAGNDPS